VHTRSVVDELVEAIDAELERVRKRPIDDVFNEAGEAVLSIPKLEQFAKQTFPVEWHENPVRALTLSLTQAIGQLDDIFGDKTKSRVTRQEAAFSLYNLDGAPAYPTIKHQTLEHISGQRYAYLARQVYEKAQAGSESAGSRYLKKLRLQLAAIIADALRTGEIAQNVPQTAASPSGDLSRPIASIAVQLRKYDGQPFVERGAYAQAFQQLIDQDQRCVVLSGGRGNGKSRLALELVAQQPGALEDGIFLKASSAELISRELHAVFTARGMQVKDWLKGFAELVSDSDAPSYVILDNLEHPGLLDELLPSHYRSTVVVTAHQRIPARVSSTLEVGPMTDEEATSLAGVLLPDHESFESEKVARTLGGRPLAIVHTCGYILGAGVVTVDEFLADLKTDAASTLETPELAAEETLTAIYQRILVQLGALQEGKRVPVRDLLELVSCLASDDIPSALLRDSLASGDETPISATTFSKAVLALRSRYLMTVVDGRFAVHPLTQEIIRALLRSENREEARCLQLHRPIRAMISGETRRHFIGDATVQQLPHICRVALGLREVEPTVFRAENFGQTLSVIWRGSRQTTSKREYIDAVFLNMMDFLFEVAGRFARDDEAGSISFDDAVPLIRELIPTVYDWGPSDSETYLFQTATLLEMDNLHDLEQYVRLPVQGLLDICTALHAHGRYTDVTAVLRSQEGRVRASCHDAVLLGDSKKLEGWSWSLLAEWALAETALFGGLALYKQADDDPLAIRGQAHSYLLLGELFLLSGQVEKCETNFEQVQQFVDRQEERLEQDVLTAAYIKHCVARMAAAEHLRDNFERCQKMKYPISELASRLSDNEVDRLTFQVSVQARESARVLNMQADARKAYEIGQYMRAAHDLAYDHVTISGLALIDQVDEAVESYNTRPGELAVDALLRIRMQIARAKVLAFHNLDTAVERCFQSLAECANLLDEFQAAYWSTEYNATCCVLYAHLGVSHVDQIMADLLGNYAQIGRMDRFEYLNRAVQALRQGDQYAFKRAFSYLLTF
jgi:hypothetical protein